MKTTSFKSASPAWAKSLRSEMNISLSFIPKCKIENNCLLRIAGGNLWQIFVDGELFAAGPARTAQGYSRVDEHIIPPCDELEILVAGYNVNSYYVMDTPPFLQAEIISENEVLAATGKDGFVIRRKNSRLQKVQRYSYQRPFIEVYDMSRPFSAPLLEEVVEPLTYIEREVPYAEYERVPFNSVIKQGSFEFAPTGRAFEDWWFPKIGSIVKAFPMDELECKLSDEMCNISDVSGEFCNICSEGYQLDLGKYAIFTLGRALSGFISLEVQTEGGVLYGSFDEKLTDGDVDFIRIPACSAVKWTLPKGKHKLTMFEPYSLQFFKLAATAKTVINKIELIRFDFPSKNLLPAPEIKDATLKMIYDASLSSFRANVLDLYMDCPTRERAPWLCDSFFIAIAERALTGKSTVEAAFLEHYLMRDEFDNVPVGMITSCYPADHNDHGYIPNWAMWYVLQLAAYSRERKGDKALVEKAKKKLYDLMDFFRQYENSDGLMEKTVSWVLIDYSRSDELTKDINYPLNMLYSKALRTVGELYSDEKMIKKAEKLASKVLEKSYNNGWFCDNAVYDESGIAKNSGECTEACQYYAFFCDIVTPETHTELWNSLVRDFGSERIKTGRHPEIPKANIFLGYMLRLYLLTENGYYAEALKDIKLYFKHMAEETGTLWEYDEPTNSLNHGFTSFVAAIIKKCLENTQSQE